MTNATIPSLSLAVSMYREGTITLAEVARAAILNRVGWRDMWHLLNSLQVAVHGYSWDADKQYVCDCTKQAQSEARAMIAADKAATKSAGKAPAMIDRIMAKYTGIIAADVGE